MATYRQIHISFWQDPFVLDLSSEEKFFYLYLMTNSKTTQCGIYELHKKIAELETGFSAKTVDNLMQKFIDCKKILYNEQTKEIMIINWLKYNPINCESIKKCVEKELAEVKTKEFIQLFGQLCEKYGYSVDIPNVDGINDTPTTPPSGGLYTPTTPQGEEEEKEKEEEKEGTDNTPSTPPPYEEIKKLYNDICISFTKVKALPKNRKEHIKARWNQFKCNIDIFKEAFKKIEASDFCKGQNNRGWKADFDWLIKNDSNMLKVLEGKYDNRASPQREESFRDEAYRPMEEEF